MIFAKPPLILHVIHHLYIGGMENGLINLINQLPSDQFRHAIVCIEDYSEFRNRITREDVEVFALNRSDAGVWKLRWKIFSLCRRLKPALVHTRNMSGLDALLPARLAGVPYCVHGEHGWDVDNLDGHKRKPLWLRRLHAPLVNRYVAVSRDLKRYLQEMVGIPGTKISQIYNGVDVERFAPASAKPLAWLPSEFRHEQLIRIGTVGRLQAVKDQACLLRAFSILLEKAPSLGATARLIIVGDGPLRVELKQLAIQLRIDRLCFFAGARNDIPQVLQSLDLFVLPSLNEGISNTILEAMASGLPVLATAVGGNVELIEQGESGSLFDAGDAEQLSKFMFAYISNQARRNAESVTARHVAVSRYSLNTMLVNYGEMYQQLLRTTGGSKTHS